MWALAALLLGSAAGYALARALPARYTSTAMVGEVSSRMPGPALPATEFTATNLAALKQQTFTQAALESMAAKLGAPGANPQAVARLEKDIVLSPSAAGFTVSFTAGDAKTAQQFCGDVAAQLLQQELNNIEHNAAREASGIRTPTSNPVTEFLAAQVVEAKRTLDEREARVADYKRLHAGELAGPDRAALEKTIAANESQLRSTDATLKRSMEQRSALTESLFALQSAAPSSRKPAASSTEALEQELADEQARLVSLEARYTPDHPDVVKLRSDIAQLQKKIDAANKAAGSGAPQKSGTTAPATPAQLQAQIRDLDQVILEKTREQGRLQQEILNARSRLASSSITDQEYRELTSETASARTLYSSLLSKQNDAQKAAQIATFRSADSLRVVEPPNLPQWPEYPNPFMFALAGAGVGIAIGLAAIVAVEMNDKSLRTEGDVEFFLDLPTLAVIPVAGAGDGAGGNGD